MAPTRTDEQPQATCGLSQPEPVGAAAAMMRKRRRRFAWFVMRVANGFFRLARNPVEAIASRAEWSRWEVDSFRLLHSPEFGAFLDHSGLPFVSILPGDDLSRRLSAGILLPEHAEAAGVELRRAHALFSPYFGSGWSHADCHTGNFVFEEKTGRARLVDFEMRHLRRLSEPQRHADDLLIFLQDVCGRCTPEAWLPLTAGFLEGYGRWEIIGLLGKMLHVPRGFPRLWWGERTTWMPRRELECRMAALLGLLSKIRTN